MRCRQIPCFPQEPELLRNFNALQANSLVPKEQGIFLQEQGIFSMEQGIFRRNREFREFRCTDRFPGTIYQLVGAIFSRQNPPH
jgi:hypothetical protein